MTSSEFVIWLKGFTEGVHEYNVTPKQWDLLKEKLNQVTDQPKSIGVPLGPYGTGTPNHDLVNRDNSAVGLQGTVYNVPAVTTSGYLSASYISATTAPANTTLTFKKEDGTNWYTITTSEDLLNYKSTKIENNSGNK